MSVPRSAGLPVQGMELRLGIGAWHCFAQWWTQQVTMPVIITETEKNKQSE